MIVCVANAQYDMSKKAIKTPTILDDKVAMMPDWARCFTIMFLKR